jgi:hypothetical protein
MVEVFRMQGGYALGFFFTKEVTEQDLDIVIAEIDKTLECNEKISILCDLVDFESLTPKALLKDLIYGIGSLGRMYRFQRVALVADSAILRTLVGIESHLFGETELRSFPSTEKALAVAWFQLPIDQPGSGLVLSEIEQGNYIRVEVKNRVTGHDIRRLCQAIRYRYENHGPVNLLVKLGFRPMTGPGLLYEKLRAFEILNKISKFALVAPDWARSRAEALSSVIRTRIRCFPPDHMDTAVEWLVNTTPTVSIYPIVRGHLVALRMVGKITEREVKQMYYLLMPHLEHEGGIDLLLEVPYDEGMTLQGSAKAIQLGIAHFSELNRAVRRLAVITDSRWIATIVRIENLFMPGTEERVFSFAQRDRAEAWLQEGRETPEDVEAYRNIAAWDVGLV